jgi:hypothetical protein
LDDINDTTPVVLKEITDEWKKVDDNTIWKYNFSKLVSGNGVLYYSKKDSVYSFNPVTKEEKVVITPEEVLKATGNNSNYAIYGLNFDGCTLKGEYSTTPNYEVTTKTEKPFSVDIHTQGKDWVSLVSPTETKKGKEAITCVNCDYIFKEREVAVLGNEDVKASITGEIKPAKDFYDYEDKYINGASTYDIPAKISESQMKDIREMAIKAFKALDGKGLSRVDFFIDKNSGEIFINEINTLPGFTNISMYPKMWEATGLEYSKLIDKLIELALDSKK